MYIFTLKFYVEMSVEVANKKENRVCNNQSSILDLVPKLLINRGRENTLTCLNKVIKLISFDEECKQG